MLCCVIFKHYWEAETQPNRKGSFLYGCVILSCVQYAVQDTRMNLNCVKQKPVACVKVEYSSLIFPSKLQFVELKPLVTKMSVNVLSSFLNRGMRIVIVSR